MLKVLSERENPLFNRKEIEINIENNVAPRTREAEEFVAKELSTSADSVKIKKIKGRFGSNNFIITANVYHSLEDKNKIEPKKKEKTAKNKEAKSEKSEVSDKNRSEKKE